MSFVSDLIPGSAARDAAKTSAAIAKRNAQIAEQEATRKEQVGAIEKQRILDRREQLVGRQRALTAARGFTQEGSPLLRQIDIAEQITLDALTAQFNTQVGVQQSRQEAQLSRFQAKSFRRTGKLAIGRALTSLAIQAAVGGAVGGAVAGGGAAGRVSAGRVSAGGPKVGFTSIPR